MRGRSLSQRFLIVAIAVVSVVTLGLGYWLSDFVQNSVTRGVGETAAAGVDSLLAHAIEGIGMEGPLTAEEHRRLEGVFEAAANVDTTPLFNIRIRNIAGTILYQSDPAFGDEDDQEGDVAKAIDGKVHARLLYVALAGVGGLPTLPLEVMEIYSPVRALGTGTVVGVAELYFSADAVVRLRNEAQTTVWLLTGLSGVLIIAALYLVVDRATRTIARQRRRLADELSASRRLSSENLALSRTAQDLRRQAATANEALLAKVGSDIHDGPIQMLTLTILRLTKARKAGQAGLDASIQVVTDTLEDLRNISSGLVLPELHDADLEEVIGLAARRHEALTGTTVTQELDGLEQPVALAVKVAAYRVVQEALSNAFRHGGGVGQVVGAGIEHGVLTLTIANQRMAKEASRLDEPSERLGLRGMRLRVEAVGGRLEIDFGEDRTTVSAAIPLGDEAAQGSGDRGNWG